MIGIDVSYPKLCSIPYFNVFPFQIVPLTSNIIWENVEEIPTFLLLDWMRVMVMKAAMVRTKLKTIIMYSTGNVQSTQKWACSKSLDQQSECKLRRSQPSQTPEMRVYFFCRQPAGNEGHHEATTFQLSNRVCLYYTELLVQLGTGPWWPLKPGINKHAKKANLEGLMVGINLSVICWMGAHTVEEIRQHDGSAPAFKLSLY